jgi:mono/diheme cytochrome c family protein
VPRVIPLSLLVLAVAALLPFACIARARSVHSPVPRLHVWLDMDVQSSYRPQEGNPLFADRRATRRPVAGTVARDEPARFDERFSRGLDGAAYVTRFPIELSAAVLVRGQERYGIYCAPCHGLAGYGDGMIARRADALGQGAWVPPSSFHEEPAIGRPVGHLFNTITNGIRTMPAYGPQIPLDDRWAIVAYVRALQRSQRSPLDALPAELRATLLGTSATAGAAERER